MAKCFTRLIERHLMNKQILLLQFFIILINLNCFVNQCFPIDDEDSSSTQDNHQHASHYILFDSDILVSRKPPVDSNRLWPNKTIPFTFHECNVSLYFQSFVFSFLFFLSTAITDLKKRLILHAIHQWSSETCVRFQRKPQEHETQFYPRGGKVKRNINHRINYWVNFRADSTGCYSFVGRDESCIHQGQPLSISRGCDSVGYNCYLFVIYTR